MSSSIVFVCDGCGTKVELSSHDRLDAYVVAREALVGLGSPQDQKRIRVVSGDLIRLCSVVCWLMVKRKQLDAIEASWLMVNRKQLDAIEAEHVSLAVEFLPKREQ